MEPTGTDFQLVMLLFVPSLAWTRGNMLKAKQGKVLTNL